MLDTASSILNLREVIMIAIEKFKIKNIAIAKRFMPLNNNLLNKNFLDILNKSTLIERYILKKNFYFLKYKNTYIGYIWFEKKEKNEYKILNFFIESKFIEIFSIDSITHLKNKFLMYEGINTSSINYIMENNSFIEIKNVLLMKKSLSLTSNLNMPLDKNLKFKRFLKNKDEHLRSVLQNSIFYNKNRIPLTEADIFFDESQEYYLDEFSIFLYYKDLAIGYAQIIKKDNCFFLVNFGVEKDFRKNNFGNYLLNYMCDLACQNEIKDLYINVNADNLVALNLYKKNNFMNLYNVSTWIRDS